MTAEGDYFIPACHLSTRDASLRTLTPVVTVTGGHNTRLSLAALIATRPGHQARLIYRTHLGLELAKLHTALSQVAATALNSDAREWTEVAGRQFSSVNLASRE